jgi:hypothetical protein
VLLLLIIVVDVPDVEISGGHGSLSYREVMTSDISIVAISDLDTKLKVVRQRPGKCRIFRHYSLMLNHLR